MSAGTVGACAGSCTANVTVRLDEMALEATGVELETGALGVGMGVGMGTAVDSSDADNLEGALSGAPGSVRSHRVMKAECLATSRGIKRCSSSSVSLSSRRSVSGAEPSPLNTVT